MLLLSSMPTRNPAVAAVQYLMIPKNWALPRFKRTCAPRGKNVVVATHTPLVLASRIWTDKRSRGSLPPQFLARDGVRVTHLIISQSEDPHKADRHYFLLSEQIKCKALIMLF